ncbi:hypothetical protein HGRIS_008237 [Hohenbuehelia grisea]
MVRCPFKLAVTPSLATSALASVHIEPQGWTERQLICTYICFHWILDEPSRPAKFAHRHYIGILPSADKLRTPLHFTTEELEAFRGSNLYAATLDRTSEWQSEWEQCQKFITQVNQVWGTAFTWDRYLTAATYLSSRAFPSTVLSQIPSLASTPSAYPILLPGIDSLNHERARPVTWLVSHPDTGSMDAARNFEDEATISVVLHKPTALGEEILNNYGAKPNAELILGYGFSIPQNPDDTILLKIGGGEGKRWEVGRQAQGIDGVWEEVQRLLGAATDASERLYEDDLEAAEVLSDMIQSLLDRLPDLHKLQATIRSEVMTMLRDYVEGQKDILDSVNAFAEDKKEKAIESAREQGIELVFEDD